jgi:hypothetical protein
MVSEDCDLQSKVPLVRKRLRHFITGAIIILPLVALIGLAVCMLSSWDREPSYSGMKDRLLDPDTGALLVNVNDAIQVCIQQIDLTSTPASSILAIRNMSNKTISIYPQSLEGTANGAQYVDSRGRTWTAEWRPPPPGVIVGTPPQSGPIITINPMEEFIYHHAIVPHMTRISPSGLGFHESRPKSLRYAAIAVIAVESGLEDRKRFSSDIYFEVLLSGDVKVVWPAN